MAKAKQYPVGHLLMEIGVVLCVVFSFATTVGPVFLDSNQLCPPIGIITVGGITVVQSRSEIAYANGIALGDRVLSVDGVPAEVWFRRPRSTLMPNVQNTYEIENREARRGFVRLAPEPITWRNAGGSQYIDSASVITGCIFFIIGLAVWIMRRGRKEAWGFFLLCSAVSIQLFIIRATSMGWIHVRTQAMTPLIALVGFYFLSNFPVRIDWVYRERAFRFLVTVFALISCALVVFETRLGLPPGTGSRVAFVYAALVCTGSIAMLVLERFLNQQGNVIDLIDVLLLSIVIGFLPLTLAVTAQIVLRTSFPLPFALAWLVTFPCGVGYIIVRRQTLLEMRAAAKSSAYYGLISLLIAGLIALLVTFVNASISGFEFGTREYWVSVGYLFGAILIINPVRTRLQAIADRVFDRDRARYQRTVKEISEAMVSMISLQEIVQRMIVALTGAMGVRRAMVLLFDQEKLGMRPVARHGDWSEEASRIEIPSDHPIEKYLWMRREPISILDFEDESQETVRRCREIFERLELEFLVPILFGADLLGAIAVGEKMSGDRFDRYDRELLGTLANQSAIAIENAEVFAEVAQLNETLEARVDERSRELQKVQAQLSHNEKMVSLGHLVAGVAHELNNPIGFVHANLQLIDEHIAKLVAARPGSPEAERARIALGKLVTRSREGTERVKGIVENLRTFSRLDHAEISEVNLNECIDSTLLIMRPRLREGIHVEKHYGTLPLVRCFAGQLNQVFLNLIVNACDALGDNGTITIRTEALGDGVRLSFADDGPGIPKEIQTQIFDPFFTTKDVGKGTGLGLSLSHGIIERHHGQIRVESEVGVGTCFTIDLPLDVGVDEDAETR